MLDPWVGKIPWGRKWQPTPVFFLGKSRGQKSLTGYIPWFRQKLDMTDHARACVCVYVHTHTHYLQGPTQKGEQEGEAQGR